MKATYHDRELYEDRYGDQARRLRSRYRVEVFRMLFFFLVLAVFSGAVFFTFAV